MGNTQKSINRVCDYRGIPPVKKGARCVVSGNHGTIVGGNSSANFNVKFDAGGRILNCHPYWKMEILNADGSVYYKYDKLEQQRHGAEGDK